MTERDSGLRWIRPPQQARSQETLHRILDAAPDVSRSSRLDVIEALIELYEACDQPEKVTEYRALLESI